jgi:undecaprenyl diphosphate synthase
MKDLAAPIRANFTGLIRAGSAEEKLFQQLNLARLPRHVAVIMDGNGRWAQKRHLPRVAGHRAGIEAVRDTVETAARLNLKALTLFAFSTENWKRPATEVSTLMKLLKEFITKELETLIRHQIRFCPLGRIHELENSIQAALSQAAEKTAHNPGLVFNVALNYSGRAELVDAVRALWEAYEKRGIRPSMDEQMIAENLYTTGLPDPDLLIRTSGELRISNFLLWQIAYTEIWVTETLWPDFRRRHFLEALLAYQNRERRYGGLTAQ